MSEQFGPLYEFGPFSLNVRERLFLKNQVPIALAPKAFDTLVALVRKNGHLVEKDELLREVWPDTFVEECNLTQNIYLLRKVLGEGTGEQFIETVPRHGYRFIADVRELKVKAYDELMLHEQTSATIIIEEEMEKQDNLPDDDLSLVGPVVSPSPVRRGLILPLLLLLGLSGVALTAYLWPAKRQAPEQAVPRSIAVLPFKSLNAEGEDEHLGLGMADATITKLSSLKQLGVIPTTTIFRYAGQGYDPVAVGRELKVDAVLDGTIQKDKETVRVTVRLIRVSDGQPLWSDKFDEQFTNVFALQDIISEKLTASLKLNLSTDERKYLTKRYTQNTQAYEAYVRGLYFWNQRTEEGLRRSLEYFEKATVLDDNYALAYAMKADSYSLVGYLGYENIMQPKEAYAHASALARKALELDASLAEAYVVLAIVKLTLDNDSVEAEKAFVRAFSLNPDSGTTHFRYSYFLMGKGRLDEAAAHARRAHELDPLSSVICAHYAGLLFFQRKYEDALRYSRKILELEPSNPHALLLLGLSYEQMGKYDEAIAALEKRRSGEKSGPDTETLRSLGRAYALAGRKEEARQMLSELDEMAARKGEALFSKALVHAALGEMEQAFQVLEKRAPAWREVPLAFRVDPRYDSIRDDPRYVELIKRRFGRAS